jgi:hypothetical protein
MFFPHKKNDLSDIFGFPNIFSEKLIFRKIPEFFGEFFGRLRWNKKEEFLQRKKD